jgi:hypothetical protein
VSTTLWSTDWTIFKFRKKFKEKELFFYLEKSGFFIPFFFHWQLRFIVTKIKTLGTCGVLGTLNK